VIISIPGVVAIGTFRAASLRGQLFGTVSGTSPRSGTLA
jgi:hypothetical protein